MMCPRRIREPAWATPEGDSLAKEKHRSEPAPSARDGGPGLGNGLDPDVEERPSRLPKKVYEQELFRLQSELVSMQEWVRTTGNRVVVVFEGRDAAGKGGAIKRIAQYLNPRIARIVALPAPTERERTQWYFERYLAHLPSWR